MATAGSTLRRSTRHRRPPPPPFVPTPPSAEYLALSEVLSTQLPLDSDKPESRKLLVLDLNGTLVLRSPRTYSGPRTVMPRPFSKTFKEYLFREGSRLVGVWARDTLGLSSENYSQKVQTVKDLEIVWRAPAGLPPPVKIMPPPPMAILTNDPTSIPGYDSTKPPPEPKKLIYTSFQLMPESTREANEADRTGYFDTPEVKLGDPIPGLSTTDPDVDTMGSARPSGLYSALNSLLLDDSALKAHMQPYNHLTLPEYTADLRTRDVRRQNAVDALASGAPVVQEDDIDVDDKAGERGDSVERDDTDSVGKDTASEQRINRSQMYKHLRAAPYDKTLLAVIGVLSAVRYESSLVGWMRAGGMRPSEEEAERVAALFPEENKSRDNVPEKVDHADEAVGNDHSAAQTIPAKRSSDLLGGPEQASPKRSRPDPSEERVELGSSTGLVDKESISLPTKRKRHRARQKNIYPVDHPLSANDPYPFFTDGKPETKLWFQDRDIYTYWAFLAVLDTKDSLQYPKYFGSRNKDVYPHKMAPYTKPEAVLKQAEGLISVGQQSAALQSLTEMFSSKRFRSTPLTSLEPIVLRFLELCVDLRKGRIAKEGLMQYKNIAQNTSVASIETVVKKFILLADAKVQEAQEKADQLVAVDDVDDLEATETPENVLLSAVSGDQNKDRTDRALVTPWLKFLWESYRTALETLKNNARLEGIYQQIAAQAFKFCLKHSRKVEFRRLCETLRLHLSNVAKYVNQAYSINLADPDTLQRHLDTRFAQLNTSVELELWQEAFRSVEDIHNLLTMAKKAPRPAMMANYYEKLTKIFLTSGNALFHAAAWARYYSVLRAAGGGGKTEEEMSRLAGQVLVSALAVPVGVESEEESSASRRNNTRLTALLGLSKPPTRSGLLKDALARNTLKLSPTSVRSLHNLLEVTFQPLTLCASITPIVAQLAQDPSYAPYLPLVHRAVLSRLFTQLSEVYTSVRISHIYELVAPLNANITPETPGLSSESPYTPERIELFVVGCAKRGELRVLVEHIEGNVTFVEDALPRTRVSELAHALHASLLKIAPPPSAAESAAEKFAALVKGAQEDRRRLLIQRAVVARRRELASELQVRREREEASRRADTAKRERFEEEQRALQERREREKARVQKEIESVRKEEARKLAEQLKARGNLKVNDVELEEMDTTKLIQLQVSQIDREKKELNDKQRIISKRVDHLERALRRAEIPLLEQDYERQKADDKAAHEAATIATIANAEQAHREAIETKQRLSRMMDDYNDLRRKIAGQREVELQKKKAEMKEKIDKAKAARRETVLKEREEARLAEENRKEEEERRAAEEARLEEERRAAEEAKRAEEEAAAADAAAKREALLEAKRKEQEAALAKLKYEEEAERRREERRAQAAAATSSRPNGADPGAGVWRKPPTAASASTPTSGGASPTPASSSGKWVPPARRAAVEPPARSGSPASPAPAAAPVAAPAGGGWRAREAARAAASGGSPNPSSTPQPEQPSTPALEDDGFKTVPSQAKWRPNRGRGFGSTGRS
ncbi:unnamed protein product [Rhizoctonia solani]|uniref:Eukaryotic translation initiation factor 3 subunit A n=1 Tax=Rhizoctonia solani TaxID=456999 RepID=A0A8H3GR04_9AGAM|nr:unnamed protein product [Rhizoctonia solani]